MDIINSYLVDTFFTNNNLEAIVLLFGGNDLSTWSNPHTFLEKMWNLLGLISRRYPDCYIVTGSILPRRLKTEKQTERYILDAKIVSLNHLKIIIISLLTLF